MQPEVDRQNSDGDPRQSQDKKAVLREVTNRQINGSNQANGQSLQGLLQLIVNEMIDD